MLKLLHRYKHF